MTNKHYINKVNHFSASFFQIDSCLCTFYTTLLCFEIQVFRSLRIETVSDISLLLLSSPLFVSVHEETKSFRVQKSLHHQQIDFKIRLPSFLSFGVLQSSHVLEEFISCTKATARHPMMDCIYNCLGSIRHPICWSTICFSCIKNVMVEQHRQKKSVQSFSSSSIVCLTSSLAFQLSWQNSPFQLVRSRRRVTLQN